LANQSHTLALLQTLPGVDLIGAAMLLVEIGSDMSIFNHPEPPDFLGRHLPRQPRVGGKAPIRTRPQGQSVRPPTPL
jgi:hypothetical protein